MLSGFFHLCRRAQHHLTEGQHHFERSENIIVRLRTQNDVTRWSGSLEISFFIIQKRSSRLQFAKAYDIINKNVLVYTFDKNQKEILL